MVRELGLTTQRQEFLKEAYLKEFQARVNWCSSYGKDLQIQQRKPKCKKTFKLPAITDQSILPPDELRKLDHIHHPEKAKQVDDNATTNMAAEMRPASPRTLGLLYYGTSREKDGRYRYLQARYHIKPEEKYSYPITTNFTYGWKLGNMYTSQFPFYGCYCVVNDTFYRKNGISFERNPLDSVL
ncbi:protein ATP6V1FNB-like [Xenopus laevis]|uniref:Sperm microtubule inner protein 1 C-terminal domain-containing protein n=2 Tax=Xenopus laevis TaxID=8355 RepID=A0A974DCB7_XENLA|nr:protein ATP6V1FNB-like [Xenopus laevis]OCT89294.1 hypothetical protein XELAEV_18017914mg [Xenopus laevis]